VNPLALVGMNRGAYPHRMRGWLVGMAWMALVSSGCLTKAPTGSAASTAQPATPRMQTVEVVVYGTEWCPVCTRARSWLDAGGYRYRWFDVDRDVQARVRHRWLNPSGSVPTFEVAGRPLVGFDGSQLRDAVASAAGESTW
jgi:glutaredoxin